MNFKQILLGSAVAVSTFGLIACGGDSGSNAEETPASSSGQGGAVINIPKASTLNPVQFSNIRITQMTGAVAGTQKIALSGLIKLDPDFENTEQPYTAFAETHIDSVTFAVGHVVNGQIRQEAINIPIGEPADRISLSEMSFQTSELSSCGDFNLYIFVHSSTKEEGLSTSTYTSVFGDDPEEQAPGVGGFTRSESECNVAPIESSSSEQQQTCTQATAHEVKLSNSLGSDQSAINFETGFSENPHLIITFQNEAAYATAGAGVTIVEDNYTQVNGMLPVGPVCLESFQPSATPVNDELANGTWIDVITADGKIYPFMVGKTMMENESKGYIIITYFK
jgi:hypothetical protein